MVNGDDGPVTSTRDSKDAITCLSPRRRPAAVPPPLSSLPGSLSSFVLLSSPLPPLPCHPPSSHQSPDEVPHPVRPSPPITNEIVPFFLVESLSVERSSERARAAMSIRRVVVLARQSSRRGLRRQVNAGPAERRESPRPRSDTERERMCDDASRPGMMSK
ncbi:hypothetical protein SCHPADRAFT_707896 [Schizopora paradoxa]|uniref:Uncharacterized protein n=1 Tax=Schizopora paradoxa TaxID=27342 RepID=A0A0H2R3H4_9AGAM|nr:hypothetical protein SCHPADRAFT_707896 [Schizopora paradoxa]